MNSATANIVMNITELIRTQIASFLFDLKKLCLSRKSPHYFPVAAAFSFERKCTMLWWFVYLLNDFMCK